VGGGLTLTKPTGPTGLIQNVAKVGKVSGGNSGSLIVSSILRTNDVPNLPTGKIWVGDGNTIVSDTVYLDETNGRMGIGTTSPSAKLEVNGDIAVSGDNKVYSEGDTLTLRAGGTSGTYLMVDDTVGGVGIGTTSIGYALDVNGDVRASSNLYLGSYVYHNGDTNTYFGFPTNDTYAVRTNGSDILYINSSGDVGIGTTSPDRRLHVQDSAIVITKLEGTNQGSLLDLVNSNASQTYNGLRFTQGTTGKMAITHIADGTTKGYVQIGNNWAAGSEILVVDGRTSNVGIGTTSPSYKLDVSGAGRFTDTLTVQGTGNSSFAGNIILNTNATYLYGELLAGTQTRIHGINSSNLEWVGSIDALVAGTLIGNNTSYINLRTGNTDRVRVDSSGNVGIGTTSPSYKLDVSGTGRFTGTTLFQSQLTVAESSGDSVLEVGNSGMGGNHRINIIPAGSGQDAGYYISGTPRVYTNTGNPTITRINAPSTGIIQFETNLTERVRINNSGNVGIGTTSPGEKLTVFGNIMLRNPNGANPTDAGSFIFNESGTTWGTDIYGFRFNLNGISNVLTLQSANTTTVNDIISFTRDAGNVGIGTTSPTAKLHVVGLPTYADNATALAGGLTVGAFYHTAGVLKVVI
jgi:hypothetical protein